MTGLRSTSGQASVEAVALLPLLVGVVAGVVAVLSAGAASEAADAAAHSAAVALLQGRDAKAAARAALDDWPRQASKVTVSQGRVTVTVRPQIPLAPLAKALEAKTSADTAAAAPTPAARPVVTLPERRGGDGRSARP
jgi:Flp pilus assembly protein TadG